MEEIEIKSRSRHKHKLVEIEEGKYLFKSAEDWMPLRVICGKDENGKIDKYKAIDPDGGPMLNIGDIIDGKEIIEIEHKPKVGYILTLKEVEK